MERLEAPRIGGIAHGCQSDFTSLLAAASGEGYRTMDFLHPRDVQQLQDRFNQWASNIGALQPVDSPLSLEHRLRNAPMIRDFILRVLTDLRESMQAGKTWFTCAFNQLMTRSYRYCSWKATEQDLRAFLRRPQ